MKKGLKIFLWIIGSFIVLVMGVIFFAVIQSRFSGRNSSTYPSPDSYDRTGNSFSPLSTDTSNKSNSSTSSSTSTTSTSRESAIPDENSSIDQKVIKTADYSMEVESVDTVASEIEKLTLQKQGFVSSSSVTEYKTTGKSGAIVVRIPAQYFDSFRDEIKKLAKKVERESVTGTDITEEYTDLTSRLKNLRAEEEAYIGVLAKATTVEDILLVQKELSNVREEIEVIEGRIKYLDDKTDFSTLTFYISEEEIIGPDEFKPVVALKNSFQSLVNTWKTWIIGIIWIVVYVCGLLLPLGIGLWLVIKFIRGMVKRRKQRKEEQKNPPIQ